MLSKLLLTFSQKDTKYIMDLVSDLLVELIHDDSAEMVKEES